VRRVRGGEGKESIRGKGRKGGSNRTEITGEGWERKTKPILLVGEEIERRRRRVNRGPACSIRRDKGEKRENLTGGIVGSEKGRGIKGFSGKKGISGGGVEVGSGRGKLGCSGPKKRQGEKKRMKEGIS